MNADQPIRQRLQATRGSPTTIGIIKENEPEVEGKSQIIQGDNFSIVDLKAYNRKGKDNTSSKQIKSSSKWWVTKTPRKTQSKRPSSRLCLS